MNKPFWTLNSYEKGRVDILMERIRLRREAAIKAWEGNDDITFHLQINVIEDTIRELREILFL